MGSDQHQLEQSSTPKLSLLFSTPVGMESPERPGMITPPLYSSASVPFRWEEEPGKPKTCTTLTTYSNPKCLELPPRLLLMEPSPTTVLDGPYMGRSKIQTYSFRLNTSECYGSFRRNSFSPERDQHGAIVISKKGQKEKGFLGSWRKKGKRDVGGGSYVFPSSVDRESDCSREDEGRNVTGIRRTGSFSTLSARRSNFWATICGGLKQVVPWKSRKVKKDRLLG
ncbi:uncharacterized protein At4g00950-like [Mangifera indica]|uniref:uncharacterized protein At4g00950-like n=1 Tax=Mangifera indica TaxID=29780 RepID=UPI001CF9D9D3|nr:uncharacterized protein At4g00950-like [Mangifera indica]